jgi:uncharacterized membrane protein
MFSLLCHSGTWGSVGNFGVWDSIGLILNLVFWVGLIAALTLLVVLAVRRAYVPAAAVPSATGQPTAKEILQAQYAQGEITREQYETMKQEIG